MLCNLIVRPGLSWFRVTLVSYLLWPGFLSANEYDDYVKKLGILMENPAKPSVGSVASGFGAANGVVFAAVSYSDKDLQTNLENDDDGSIILGLGLGEPDVSVGVELAIGLTSVSTAYWGDGKFADEGNVNLKLHKFVSPKLWGNTASVAIGSSNLTGWGETKEIPNNNYIVYSEQRFLGEYHQYGLAYSIGYGSAVANRESDNGFFGGFSIARSDYSGSVSFINDEVHLAATWYLPYFSGMTVNLTRADLFNNNGTERNILTIGYSFELDSFL